MVMDKESFSTIPSSVRIWAIIIAFPVFSGFERPLEATSSRVGFELIHSIYAPSTGCPTLLK